MDSHNTPRFDTHTLEGRIERPMSRGTFYMLAGLFVLIASLFLFKIGSLEIARGGELRDRSERNTLTKSAIFPTRGVIYDRRGILLAWNENDRIYKYVPGLAPVVGYTGKPNKEEIISNIALSEERIGRSGVERLSNRILRGTLGEKIEERDARGELVSFGMQVEPKDGGAVSLSIDSELNAILYEAIDKLSREKEFEGGAGVVMDVGTGEILAAASVPSFDPNIFVTKNDPQIIARYTNDPMKPFLDRVISGQYTPGSIIKPFMALAALSENIISPTKKLLSTGSIRVQNQFDPTSYTVFKDWKAHGWVDMREAIAHSSDVYFYIIGGGFKSDGGDAPGVRQEGLGIERIESYMNMFGFGESTGVELYGESLGTIPSPAWKKENFDGEEWRLGNTYHTSIGQYGFQITPIQMVRAIASIATDGNLVRPTIFKVNERDKVLAQEIVLPKEHWKVVKEGMRMSVTHGTAMRLSNEKVKVAAKTGTAELGVGKDKVNSLVVGFLPYDEPKISFVLLIEKGPRANTVGASAAMREVIDWMVLHRPEYIR